MIRSIVTLWAYVMLWWAAFALTVGFLKTILMMPY